MTEPEFTAPAPARDWTTALRRGFARRCPACGQGDLFHGLLRVAPSCARCGLATGEFRSDDAPPYFTILIVGHLVVPAVLLIEKFFAPALWLQAALWIPLTLALTMLVLPRVKGVVIGWLFATGIKG